MKLSSLFEKAPDVEINSIMADSRKKRPNSIFFCVKGMMNDGHLHVEEAIQNGAICIVYSETIPLNHPEVTYIKVTDVIGVMNQAVSAFYNYPSKKLVMFGVTGTNGKSSICLLIQQVMNNFAPCGYIGTVSIQYGSVKLPPLLTTPEIDDLHGILADMVKAGMKACSLEVSSIGIEQRRVDSIDFDLGVFTNLTHDHLDYHGTIEKYFLAKKRFFDNLKEDAVAITNADDPHGNAMVADCKCRVYKYGIHSKDELDYRAENVQILPDKTRFTLVTKEGKTEIETNLVALFNVYNLLAVIAALNIKGIPLEAFQEGLKTLPQVAGRMERVDEGQPFNVLVDFAHTPDGLEQVMTFARKITPGDHRIILVTGSAGKRDYKKRPVFGELGDKYCDMIILTEDDPRDESVRDIAEQIASGIKKTTYIIDEDRQDAIRQAIEMANPKDTILILGKGDENFMYHEFGRDPYPGDNVVAKEAIHRYYLQEGEDDHFGME